MPRFFFHLHNDLDTPDPEGRELPDGAAARDTAVREARELAAATVTQGRLDLGHFIEVADETGAPQFRVTFGDAVAVTG
jgi:hypothetical protein